LYQIYDIQEKNKLVSRSINLEWNYRELLTLLLDRIRANNIFNRLDSLLDVKPNETDQKLYTALKIIFPEQLEGKAFRE
jgi:hypothetical protein